MLRSIVGCVILAIASITSVGCSDGQTSTGGTAEASSSTGAGESCEAPLVACGATCVDTRVDPANCGACGHDCQGGACDASTCKPVTLADQLLSAGKIVVDANGVYCSSVEGLLKVPHGGGVPEKIADVAGDLAVGGNNIYISTPGGGLFAVPSGGGPLKSLGAPAGSLVAADAVNVYWVDQPAMLTVGLLKSAHGSDAPIGVTTFGNSDAYDVSDLASDGDKIFIAFGGGINPGLYEVPVKGGPTGTRTNLAIRLLAVGGSSIYAVEGSSIFEGSVVSGQLSKIASSDPQGITGLAADADGVYWTEVAGSVMKKMKGGSAPIKIAQHASAPSSIASDATSIYWSVPGAPGPDSMDAAIMKVAK